MIRDLTNRFLLFLTIGGKIQDYKKPPSFIHKCTCVCVHVYTYVYMHAYRYKRICSQNDKFEARLRELKMDLLSKQYLPKIIDEAFDKARSVTQSEALKKVEKLGTSREVFAVTFHPALPSIAKTVKNITEIFVGQ